jgi:hypothetical protein
VKNPPCPLDENIDVKQRKMSDAVGMGLVAGFSASVFICIGGLIAVYTNFGDEQLYRFLVSDERLFGWLVLLTALLVGCLIYLKVLVDFFREQPKQITSSVTVT